MMADEQIIISVVIQISKSRNGIITNIDHSFLQEILFHESKTRICSRPRIFIEPVRFAKIGAKVFPYKNVRGSKNIFLSVKVHVFIVSRWIQAEVDRVNKRKIGGRCNNRVNKVSSIWKE